MQNELTQRNIDRWNYIDLIECIGILFVIIYHSYTYQISFLNDSSVFTYLRYFFNTILSTGAPLFFFANGYLLLNKSFNLKKHIIKSIKIVVLTFIWALLAVICLMYIENENLSIIDIANYVWRWHLGWINYMWYFGALICIYVFFPLIKKVFDSEYNIFLYFTIIVTVFAFGNAAINYLGSAVMSCFGKLDAVYSFNWFNMFNPFSQVHGEAFTYFCIGGLAHKYKDRLISIKPVKRNTISIVALIISCIVLFIMGVIFSKATGNLWDVVWDGYTTLNTLISVCAIFVLSLSYNKNIRIIKCISCNTLGIFFIHEIFIHLFRPFVIKVPFMCTFLGGIIFSFAILFISLAVSLILRKIPLINNLVKL